MILLDVARGWSAYSAWPNKALFTETTKPSNVLLGDHVRAKVSDLGLVKNAPEDGQHSVETTLAGKFGYLAQVCYHRKSKDEGGRICAQCDPDGGHHRLESARQDLSNN
ncbi:Non-specific serine/threonine protein kinase [Bertholletia excelsa]